MFKREDVTHGQQPCTVVSACLFLYFNCYIFSVLIWAKRAASAESGTSKDTSPSLTSCLSLWRGPGFEMPGKGTGKAVRIPGWNEFDGLIVAPSGHRRSPQRAGWAGNRNHWQGAAAVGKCSCQLSPSSLDITTWLSFWSQYPALCIWMSELSLTYRIIQLFLQ